MANAKSGDTVSIHYTGKLEDGTVFDSSEDKEPLVFEIGSGAVIKGFDDGVTGMDLGEKKSLVIPPEEAYGLVNPDLLSEIARDQFPDEITLEKDLVLQSKTPDGHVVTVVVTELTDTTATIDANPPLAGKTLYFDVELMKIA
ncbi:MAG: peptidylprolyl isomerase [Desulfobacterales bacterium]|nr:peptidylprolyl isomerase [Desulfobacterales bacterium]MCP4159450.1 peptidylprolyl isomerase [Deltaproteobacteria bacterium]